MECSAGGGGQIWYFVSRLQETAKAAAAAMPAVPEELPEALAAIPWPWGHLAMLAVLVLGLLTYLQRRHKLLSDARLGLVFLSVLIQLFTGKPKTFVNCFNRAVKRWPHKVAIHFVDDGRELTFAEIDRMANKVAHLLAKHGLGRGDVGAIMMTNKPEYVVMELAMAKLGAVSALLNYNLKNEPLAHSIAVAGAKMVVFDDDLAPVVQAVVEKSNKALSAVAFGPNSASIPWAVSLDKSLPNQPTTPPNPEALRDVSPNEPMSLVYTSGTTGLPKAAIIKHQRIFLTSMGFARQFAIRHRDRIYCTLPLYHSAGGNIGLGMMLNLGATLVLRSKFSASNFFKDVHDTGATVTQYIGELCRYLVGTPPSEFDRRHKLRLAFGNGLRPDVWPRFVERFGIRQIGEFYGATEGNIVFFNFWSPGEPSGAIGKGGFFNRLIMGWTIVKFDPIKEEPVKDKYGRLIPCKDGEPGELLAKISATSEFSGYYKNKEATEKKIIRGAFGRKGQAWFRSGDLIMVDGRSYIHFVDRIGDTFRWKGENVSTTEVALAVAREESLDEVNIVGVEVPGKDGRACLAAVTLKPGAELDVASLLRTAKSRLPAYAVPVFVRLLPQQETTGTFKHMKAKYRAEGIDPAKVQDKMWWLCPDARGYVPYDAKAYAKIVSGEAKL